MTVKDELLRTDDPPLSLRSRKMPWPFETILIPMLLEQEEGAG